MTENAGLYSKYKVTTFDGKPLDSGTFVLRPFNADGSVHDEGAVRALRAYADYCVLADCDDIAIALTEWLARPEKNPATRELNRPLG